VVVAPTQDGTGSNRFTVELRDASGWSVAIVDPKGRDAFVRACRDEAEARTFASTVGQHIAWLSEERFREIYRLDEGVRETRGASGPARAVAPRQPEA
jgi:hypothetical protein